MSPKINIYPTQKDLSVAIATHVALLAAQMAGSVLAGHLGDAYGFKLPAVVAPACSLAACVLALTAPSPGWYYLVFVAHGLRVSSAIVGIHNLTIEFAPEGDKTAFLALGSTAMLPAYVLGPVLAGFLVRSGSAGHRWVFAVGAGFALLSWVTMLLFVREPRRESE